MIIIRIKGGLGNQLFQYAVGYAMAKRLESKLVLDTTFFPKQSLRGYKLCKLDLDFQETVVPPKAIELLKNKFLNKFLRKINIQNISVNKETTYLLETRSDILKQVFSENNTNIYLDGYFQSELYFDKYKEDLHRQFRSNYSMEDEFNRQAKEIDSTLSVAVHVRRGDFLKAKNDFNINHYLLEKQYYLNALDYLKARLPSSSVFYWFSDDIEWVKNNFGDLLNYKFVKLKTPNADIDELFLMSKCNHIVTANSTFSWWAAWLNNKQNPIRIVPARRFGNLHMIPDSWIKISVE